MNVYAKFNLWDIYQKALQSDTVFNQQKFIYSADKEITEQAKSVLRPQINAFSGVGRIRDDTDSDAEFFSGKDTFHNENIGIELSQTIWNKNQFENLQLARNQVYLSKLQLEDAQQDLYLRIASSYFNLLAAEDTLVVELREQAALRAQFEQSAELLNAGLGTSTDYFQSESRLKLAEVDVLNAQNLIADQRQALVEIINETVQELAKPGADFPIRDPSPDDPDKWLDIALKNNYELLIAHQQVDVALKNIDLAHSGHWPTLILKADQSYNDDDGGINGSRESDQRRILLELNAPIYQGGQITSQTREAKNRYSASMQNFKTVKNNIERRVRDAYNSLRSEKNQFFALNKAVEAAQNALESRQKSFESGLSTNIEVLDATRDLFAAQVDLLRSRYDYIINLFTLKSLAGVLNENDFKQISDLLTN